MTGRRDKALIITVTVRNTLGTERMINSMEKARKCGPMEPSTRAITLRARSKERDYFSGWMAPNIRASSTKIAFTGRERTEFWYFNV